MKLLINTKIIEAFNPCKNRFDNWKYHYEHREMNVDEFLVLDKITYADKLWVALRLAPRIVVETFAIDCATADTYYASDATRAADAAVRAAHATDAATYAADCATLVTVNYDTERLRQLEALEYLIRTHEEGT